LGQLQDDLDAIRKGTLTGTQAESTIQTDAAAVFASMGLSSDQISAIQADQQALQSDSGGSTATGSTSSTNRSDTASVLQSIHVYLVGIPGIGGFGMRGFGGSGFRSDGGGGSGMGFRGWR